MNTKNDKTPPILVLGLGNMLLKDEGIGGYIIKKLYETELPPHIELVDGGTFGFELLAYVENREKILIIDAISTDHPPGTIFKFKATSVNELKKSYALSLHQSSFYDVFKLLAFKNSELPNITVIGIQPKDITMGTDLTPEVAEKVPDILKLVKEELNLDGKM